MIKVKKKPQCRTQTIVNEYVIIESGAILKTNIIVTIDHHHHDR